MSEWLFYVAHLTISQLNKQSIKALQMHTLFSHILTATGIFYAKGIHGVKAQNNMKGGEGAQVSFCQKTQTTATAQQAEGKTKVWEY